MIHFLIAMLIVMSVGSVYTYNLVTTQRSAMYLQEAARESQRLDQWKALIESAALASEDSGEVMVPLGENHSVGNVSFHGLPRWISTDTQNEWGRAIRYCPYSVSAVSPTTLPVKLSNQAEYDVSTVEVAGQAYVAGSSTAPDTDIVALILSLLPGAESITCSDVIKVDGKYTVSSRQALVRVITTQSVRDAMISTPLSISINEQNSTEHEDLVELYLENWELKQPGRLIVEFGPSVEAYELPSLSFVSSSPGTLRSIIFRGSGQADTLLDAPSGEYSTIEFEGVNVEFENITLSHRIGLNFDRSTLLTNSSTVGQISGDDSQWVIKGGTIVNGADVTDTVNEAVISLDASRVIQSNPLTINGRVGAVIGVELNQSLWRSAGTSLDITSANNMAGFVLSSGSQVSLNGTALSMDENPLGVGTVSSLFHIDASSTLIGSNTTTTLNVDTESVIHSSGQSYLYDSQIDFLAGADTAIEILGPARLVLSESRVGNSGSGNTMPNVGVNASGGAFVGGEGTTIYSAGSCTSGAVFDTAVSGSESEGDLNKLFSIVNQSGWTCM